MKKRHITVNRPTRDYPTNSIETSKYTCLTFLAKNLIEQFSKLANVYFLVIIIILPQPHIYRSSVFYKQLQQFQQQIDNP